MTSPDDLLALADRCEREEPNEGLDSDIALATATPKVCSYKAYTTSLDAAVTLVPEGWSVSVGCSENRKHAQVQLGRSYPTNKVVTLEGRTMALALCAAALRARASLLPAKEGE